jgi:hypothetical protein
MKKSIKNYLKKTFKADERPSDELDRVFDLMELFLEIPPPPDPLRIHTDYSKLKKNYEQTLESGDSEEIETAFLQLYCNAHGHEAPYTKKERSCVNETGGYWAHSGGISPLVKACPWINSETVSADFGAGNGLQGLLLQRLYPHKKTVQIEISSSMIESGKELQKWLKIPEERIEWVCDNVMNQSAKNYDFIYIYRPLKPEGVGIQFYNKFAEDVLQSQRPVVIFSIADCLTSFLSDEFEVFYGDGHLTCFRKV